jgi:hypothetical protein
LACWDNTEYCWISESERISKLLEMVERSAAVKPVHVYAVHLKSDGHRAGVIDFFVIETNLSS